MTSISEEIVPEVTRGLHKKVEFHIPEDKPKSVIGLQSMTSPTVLKLLRVETSHDNPTTVPVSRSSSNEKLLKDESIMNLQGREVLFATGIFFLVSLSVAFIFIIATTTLDKFSQPSKEKTISPQIKCTFNTTPSRPTSSCKSTPFDFSETNLRGKFGRELKQKLCEITLNSLCHHETKKFNKVWSESSKLHSLFLQRNSIASESRLNTSENEEDINATQCESNVNISISFNNSYEVECSDPQNNLTEENNEKEINFLQITNVTESNKIKERNSDRILPRLSRSQGHVYIKKFWVFLRNPKTYKRFCLEKIKMAAKFFKKCIRRQKVSINALFSLIIPDAQRKQEELNSLKFYYIETLWERYGLETFFRFGERNQTINSSKVLEILPPKQLPRQHLFTNMLKSLHLLSKDEREVFTSLFRIRSRISKVISSHKMKKGMCAEFNSSSIYLAYPQINWSRMLEEKFNVDDLKVVECGNLLKQIFLMINFTWTRDIKILTVWKVISEILATPDTLRFSRLQLFFRDSKSDTPFEDMCLRLTIRIYLQMEFSEFIEKFYIRSFARILRKSIKFYGRSFLCTHEMSDYHHIIKDATFDFDWYSPSQGDSTNQCTSLEMTDQTNSSFWEIIIKQKKLAFFGNAPEISQVMNEQQSLSYDNSSNTISVPFSALLDMYNNAGNQRCSKISQTVASLWNNVTKLMKNKSNYLSPGWS